MSVRPTPDGAPRPAHRSRLAHVLRIGAERAASTEYGLVLWDGTRDGPQTPICDVDFGPKKLHKIQEDGTLSGRFCDAEMTEGEMLLMEQRFAAMMADIEANNIDGLRAKLDETYDLYNQLMLGTISIEDFTPRWQRAYKITDRSRNGSNLLYEALKFGHDSRRPQPWTVGNNRLEIFNMLFGYYNTRGDLEMKVKIKLRLPLVSSTGQFADTKITRFDVQGNSLATIALERTILQRTAVADAVRAGSPPATVNSYKNYANRWLQVLRMLRENGFERETLAQRYIADWNRLWNEDNFETGQRSDHSAIFDAISIMPQLGFPRANPVLPLTFS